MKDGVVRYRDAFAQPLLFEGVEFKAGSNSITPTDFDAVLEFRDRLFVFVEVKTAGMEIPTGQRLALERICRASATNGRQSVGMLCWHFTAKPHPVYLRDLYVGRVYSSMVGGRWQWTAARQGRSLIQVVNGLLDRCGINDVDRCLASEPSLSACPF